MRPIQKILVIETSPRGPDSVSRRLTEKVVAGLRARSPRAEVFVRDLAHEPIPHLEGVVVGAAFTPPESRTSGQKAAIALSDALVDELLEADAVVIGVPMWNFGLPSVLKAWIDHVVRANRTFSFVGGAPAGLLQKDKKVIVVKASGSRFTGSPLESLDHLEPHLKTVFGFMGVPNLEFVRAEGLNDPKVQANALEEARSAIARAIA